MTGAGRSDHDGGLVIEIEQQFAAAPERVFRRWTEADALARWFAPPGYVTVHSAVDPRAGGRWQLDFAAETGRHRYTERGAYREVDPFTRLSFTLIQVDGDTLNPETLVTVELDDIGAAGTPRTLMRFTQSGYRSPALRDDNRQGWAGCFAFLTRDLELES